MVKIVVLLLQTALTSSNGVLAACRATAGLESWLVRACLSSRRCWHRCIVCCSGKLGVSSRGCLIRTHRRGNCLCALGRLLLLLLLLLAWIGVVLLLLLLLLLMVSRNGRGVGRSSLSRPDHLIGRVRLAGKGKLRLGSGRLGRRLREQADILSPLLRRGRLALRVGNGVGDDFVFLTGGIWEPVSAWGPGRQHQTLDTAAVLLILVPSPL